jgi:hypothetical protein
MTVGEIGLDILPSRSKNAYFESYKISAKPREIKACGILQSGRFMSEKGVIGLTQKYLTYWYVTAFFMSTSYFKKSANS